MSILPRCICDPLDAMVGKYDPRCNRHRGCKPFPLAERAAAQELAEMRAHGDADDAMEAAARLERVLLRSGELRYTEENLQEAVAQERERCAKLCEDMSRKALESTPLLAPLLASSHGYRFAAAIRANKQG